MVARAIHRQIASGDGAFLDAREAIGDEFPEAFPTVFAACMAAGLDPRTQQIPVAPAAHYHMGGVATDASGATTLDGLYAAGECASTGVHGANRLASNSLLEAAVFGRRAGAAASEATALASEPMRSEPAPVLPAPTLQALRQAMSLNAGVVREHDGLSRLLDQIARLSEASGPACPLVAAGLIAGAALERTESRGAHTRSDFPLTAPSARRTLTTLARHAGVRQAAE